MNTKLVMTASAAMLGVAGIALTFAPDIIVGLLNICSGKTAVLLGQILGGLYIGFAMLNWMTRENLIGGIYHRPVVIANLTHFLVAGMALIKGFISDSNLPPVLLGTGIMYVIFGMLFGIILFKHPGN